MKIMANLIRMARVIQESLSRYYSGSYELRTGMNVEPRHSVEN
jgi:hypothetical protein